MSKLVCGIIILFLGADAFAKQHGAVEKGGVVSRSGSAADVCVVWGQALSFSIPHCPYL